MVCNTLVTEAASPPYSAATHRRNIPALVNAEVTSS